MTNQQMRIENGPSEMDLMFSLFKLQPVYFTVDGYDTKLWVIIQGLEAEDGSGKSWLIKGFIQKSNKPDKFPVNAKFNGWFDYRNHRQGWLELAKD